jgi:hypothetical protein
MSSTDKASIAIGLAGIAAMVAARYVVSPVDAARGIYLLYAGLVLAVASVAVFFYGNLAR